MKTRHHVLLPKSYTALHKAPEYWPDSETMHAAIHKLPDSLRALILEFLDRPLSLGEIEESKRHMEMRMGERHFHTGKDKELSNDLAQAIEGGILFEENGRYALTPAGRELSEHMSEVIPWFFSAVFSEKIVSTITIGVHILLSALKLIVGFLAQSAGLIADGIDSTADTFASILVWLGISWKKERLTSIFIVVMMFVSVAGVGMASYHKITHPEPVRGGMSALLLSAFCGVFMLLISAYQYENGRRNSNLAIMCQAVDSRNHVFTSLLVCIGILLSMLADRFQMSGLYYADALASVLIGVLILQSAVELSKELLKPADDPAHVSHFLNSIQKHSRAKLVFEWLSTQLQGEVVTLEELKERFHRQFCRQVPKIVTFTGIGYRPEDAAELQQYLERFVAEKKLVLTEMGYKLPEREAVR